MSITMDKDRYTIDNRASPTGPAVLKAKEVDVAKPKSETRQLNKLVGVRLTADDLHGLKREAERRGVTVPQLLRDSALLTLASAH
jgi:hypothetical protein